MYNGELLVNELEDDVRDRLYKENEDGFTFSYLTGVYVEIVFCISKNYRNESFIIHDYAKLLDKELQLYSGTEAFEIGKNLKDESMFKVMNDYFLNIMDTETKQSLDLQIQECFNKIKELLEDDSELITEFTESYGRVHGVIKNNIHEFISLGQTCE